MADDIEEKDPRGRIDILAYNVSKKFVQELEIYYGCPGMWDMVKDHVEDGIGELKLKKVPESFLTAIEKMVRIKKDDSGR